MFEWLDYAFMVRALTATTVLSFSVAPVGAFLVLRRMKITAVQDENRFGTGVMKMKNEKEVRTMTERTIPVTVLTGQTADALR